MNILLVHPRCCYFDEGEAVYKRISFPMGLMQISSAIKHIKVKDGDPANWDVSDEVRSECNISLLDAAAEGFGNEDGSGDRLEIRDKRKVRIFGLSDEEIITRAKQVNPDLILVSGIASKHLDDFYEMTRLLRSNFPDAVIVGGGIAVSQLDKPIISAEPNEEIKMVPRTESISEPYRHGVDIIVHGEAEIVAPMLVDAVEKMLNDRASAEPKKLTEYVEYIPNLRVRSEGDQGPRLTQARVYDYDQVKEDAKTTGESYSTLTEDEYNRLPLPDLDIINPDLYGPRRAHYGEARGKWIELFTSRGCSRQCAFCAPKQFFGEFRRLSDKRVMELLKHYREHGYNEVCIEDDSILDDPSRAERIFSMIKEAGFDQFAAIGGVEIRHLLYRSTGEELYLDINQPFSKDNPKCVLTKEQLEIARQEAIQLYQSLHLPPEKYDTFLERRFPKLLDGRKIIQSMAESGCYRIYLAVESANSATRDFNGKNIEFPEGPNGQSRTGSMEEVIEELNHSNIETHGGMMMGHPKTESMDGLMNNVRKCQELMEHGLSRVAFWPYMMLPGTSIATVQNIVGRYARMRFDFGNLGYSFDLANMDSLEHGWTAEELITIVQWANNVFSSGEGKNWGQGQNISKEELEKQIQTMTDPEILYQTTALRLLREGGAELLGLYHEAIRANSKLRETREITASDGLPEYAYRLDADTELTEQRRREIIQESKKITEDTILRRFQETGETLQAVHDDRSEYARDLFELTMRAPKMVMYPSFETLVSQESSYMLEPDRKEDKEIIESDEGKDEIPYPGIGSEGRLR